MQAALHAPTPIAPSLAAAAGPTVRWLEDCDKTSIAEVGGKCSSLGELIRMGVRL